MNQGAYLVTKRVFRRWFVRPRKHQSRLKKTRRRETIEQEGLQTTLGSEAEAADS